MLNVDLLDWILDESTIDYFALHGFGNQKPKHFLPSKRVYADGTERFCSLGIFKKKLIKEEKRCKWVIYSEKTGGFGKYNGFSDWKYWG